MLKTHKLAIIGLGHVGSAVLARAIACQLAAEIVCIDINPKVAHGEAVDATHSIACALTPNVHVYSGGFEEVKDADCIIVAVGHKEFRALSTSYIRPSTKCCLPMSMPR